MGASLGGDVEGSGWRPGSEVDGAGGERSGGGWSSDGVAVCSACEFCCWVSVGAAGVGVDADADVDVDVGFGANLDSASPPLGCAGAPRPRGPLIGPLPLPLPR